MLGRVEHRRVDQTERRRLLSAAHEHFAAGRTGGEPARVGGLELLEFVHDDDDLGTQGERGDLRAIAKLEKGAATNAPSSAIIAGTHGGRINMLKMGFLLDKVNLGASHLPEAIEAQLQQKMAAQQQALQAEYELQKQTTLAKAKVAQAQGEAESTLVHARAQAEANTLLQVTLNPLLIQSKAIDKWDGSLPTYNGAGVLPFLSITGK